MGILAKMRYSAAEEARYEPIELGEQPEPTPDRLAETLDAMAAALGVPPADPDWFARIPPAAPCGSPMAGVSPPTVCGCPIFWINAVGRLLCAECHSLPRRPPAVAMVRMVLSVVVVDGADVWLDETAGWEARWKAEVKWMKERAERAAFVASGAGEF